MMPECFEPIALLDPIQMPRNAGVVGLEGISTCFAGVFGLAGLAGLAGLPGLAGTGPRLRSRPRPWSMVEDAGEDGGKRSPAPLTHPANSTRETSSAVGEPARRASQLNRSEPVNFGDWTQGRSPPAI